MINGAHRYLMSHKGKILLSAPRKLSCIWCAITFSLFSIVLKHDCQVLKDLWVHKLSTLWNGYHGSPILHPALPISPIYLWLPCHRASFSPLLLCVSVKQTSLRPSPRMRFVKRIMARAGREEPKWESRSSGFPNTRRKMELNLQAIHCQIHGPMVVFSWFIFSLSSCRWAWQNSSLPLVPRGCTQTCRLQETLQVGGCATLWCCYSS